MAHETNHSGHLNKVSFAGLLVAPGIVFGDIGTSPLYTEIDARNLNRIYDSEKIGENLRDVYALGLFRLP